MHHQIVSLPIPLPTLHHILPATNVILHPFVHNHSLYLTTRRREDASSAETGQNLTCRTYVSLPVIRMEPPATSSNKNPMAQGPVGQESVTVSHGMVHPVLHSPHAARKNIPVLSAAPQITTCNYATPLPDLLIVNTPFIPDEWENLLNKLTPVNNFSDVPYSLCFGFDMGVHTPPQQTYTPPNHNSVFSYSEHIMSHIQKELSLRPLLRPFFSF